MRRTPFISTTLLATAALAAGLTGGASAKQGPTELSCTLELVTQTPPPNGTQSGTVECPDPFGSGTHYSAFTVTPTGIGTGTISATFTNTYHRGTASGTAELTFTATSPSNITYTGTVTYTGGTRKFKHVAGGGTIECTSTDGGAHKSCTVNSTLTGI
jgi:hypothetical protein